MNSILLYNFQSTLEPASRARKGGTRFGNHCSKTKKYVGEVSDRSSIEIILEPRNSKEQIKLNTNNWRDM
jgi:hypothetical protein